MSPRHLFCASLLALAAATSAHAATYSVASPNGRVQVQVDDGNNALTWSVSLDGKPIITPSPLELKFDVAYIGGGSTVTGHSETSVNDTYAIVAGKDATAPDHYNQTDLAMQTSDGKTKFHILVRAYDNGAALRYAFPVGSGLGAFKVMSEGTQFQFPADYDCWGANMGSAYTSFEAQYDPVKASLIRNTSLYEAPLVCKTGVGQTTFAIAESDVKDYPGEYLAGRGDGGLGVRVSLPPRFDSDRDFRFRNTVVGKGDATNGFQTPWRVVMIGDTPGDLTASNLIATLAAPSVIKDTSWIKPGKTAWDWWNDWDVDVPHPGINTDSYKAYIDFSASMKLDDILIDEGWSVGSSVEPDPTADVTKPIPAMDMPAILAYAKSKGVGVWVWCQWQQIDNNMDAAMATYEKWGVKGIKVDFMNRNDQEMVDYFHRILTKAAEHHLMVDLHGAYPPNGLLRTYPNYINQEGVLGAENNKWSRMITATHNVTLPFTRMILGPMDYTPGGFHNATPATFVARNHDPEVMTTRGQAVAMYVVYDSPFMMVSDAPSAYKNADGSWADGAQFISDIPTSWDETRVVQGDIGQYIVTARRKGGTWYIGAMTNEQGRTLSVPLSFLGKGVYQAHVQEDGADVTHLKTSDQKIGAGDSLTLTLAPSGGAVATITPATGSKKLH